MGELKIFFSIENSGDGEAYPSFFNSMKLADWHQDNQSEEWSENCTGLLTVYGENLSCFSMQNAIEFYLDEILGNKSVHGKNFVDEFFRGSPPQFTLQMNDRDSVYECYDILYDGGHVGSVGCIPDKQPSDENMAKVQAKLNVGPEQEEE